MKKLVIIFVAKIVERIVIKIIHDCTFNYFRNKIQAVNYLCKKLIVLRLELKTLSCKS